MKTRLALQRSPGFGDDFKATHAVEINHVVVHSPFAPPHCLGVGSYFVNPRRAFNLNQSIVGTFNVP